MREYRKLHIAGDIPISIPRYPERDYKNEWIGIGNWLGTRYIERSKRKFVSFNDAKKFVKSLNFKDMKDYKKAYEYKSSADSINAKLNSSKNRSVLADLEKQRSVYQEKNEVIRLRSAQQKQILLILVFITITTILIFFFFRTKRLNNKLAKSLVSNQTLFTILSHDFRVPLLSIKRIVDSNEDIRNSKNKLQGSVNSILTEFDNLLSWSGYLIN